MVSAGGFVGATTAARWLRRYRDWGGVACLAVGALLCVPGNAGKLRSFRKLRVIDEV